MKRKLKGGLVVSLFLLAGLLAQVAQAAQVEMPFANSTPEVAPETMLEQTGANEAEPVSGQMIVLADINFRNPLLVRQEQNQLELFFHLENKLPQSEAGIRYGVQLVKNKTILDETVYTDDVLSVAGNSSTQKGFSYTAPIYLSGDFELWLVAKNESGMPLALFKFETPLTLAGSNQYLGIDSRSCNLTVDGDKEAKDYALLQGVSLKQGEVLKLKCAVVSYFPSAVTVTPIFNTFERSLYGNLIDKDNQAEITFQPGETKLIELPVKKPTNPQAYEVRLDFLQIMTAISNPVIFHYVIAGESATIQKLDLDKVSYKKGETINATLIWSGAADNFPGSRTGKTENEKVFLSLDIFDQAKQKCADTLEKTLEPNSQEAKLALKTRANCPDPKVAVTLKNEAGTVLAQKEFDFKKETGENILQKQKMAQGRAILVWLIVLISVGLLVVFLMKRKTKTIFTKILPLIILVLFGMSFEKAEALTFSEYGTTYEISINKTEYAPGESITATGSASYPGCSNAGWYVNMEVTINGNYLTILNNASVGSNATPSGSVNTNVQMTPGNYNAVFSSSIGNFSNRSLPYTVVDNTPPSCSINFGRSSYNVHDVSSVSWSSSAATGASLYCYIGSAVIANGAVNPSNSNYSLPLDAAGTASCVLTVSNSSSSRTCSASATVTAAVPVTCTGSIPAGSTMCSGDNTGLTATLPWASAGTTSASCTAARKCEYYTSPPLTPSCTASWSPTRITAPSSSALTWSSSNADRLSFVCTGPINSGPKDTALSGTTVPSVAFTTAQTGIETCTFTPYNGSVKGETCSASVTISSGSSEYACTGSIPRGSRSCTGDDIGLTASISWAYVGTTSASCTATRKCQYYTPPASATCIGLIPVGSTMCSGDDTGLTSNLPWAYVGTTSASCTLARKCQYYTPASCSGWSATLTAVPVSGSAPLTTNLTANISAVFGGETYLYSAQSCGGGVTPTNISGNRFTCVYPIAGTYYPSISVTAQSTNCTNSPSTTVTVTSAPLNCGGSNLGTMCTGDNINLTVPENWHSVGTSSTSCTVARKCEYYVPCVPDCSCAANTCVGLTCSNGCVGTCPGIKPATCLPLVCNPGDCGTKLGQGICGAVCPSKDCGDCNSGEWIEVPGN